jgi:urea transport system substrate-binding protein
VPWLGGMAPAARPFGPGGTPSSGAASEGPSAVPEPSDPTPRVPDPDGASPSGFPRTRLGVAVESASGGDAPVSPEVDAPGGSGATAAAVRAAEARIGRMLGRHRLDWIIGYGGMGVVFAATDTRLERKVAVKLLPEALAGDPTAEARFEAEARAAARLHHPNVVAIFEIDHHDHDLYLVLEYVDGPSMARRLKDGPVPWREATRIVAEACRGLAAAHAAGLIHRDVKPANIMQSSDGTVKLTDFGLAKAVERLGESLTATGRVIGTPAYMSPEQCQSEPMDGRSDLYSLGATYFSLLTGVGPYDDSTTAPKVMFAHCYKPVPDPRSLDQAIPEGAAAIVRRAMAKEPSDRYPTADAMRADLEALLVGQEPSALGHAVKPPPAPPSVLAAPIAARRGGPDASITAHREAVPASRARSRARLAHRRQLLLGALGGAAAALGLGALALATRLLPPSGRSDRARRIGPQAAAVPAPAGPPIRVGVLHSQTGTMATSEEGPIQGALLAIDEINQAGGVLGRQIEPVLADGASDPETFAREAERLITEQRVRVLFGCWTSASRKMVKPVVERHNHLLVYPIQYEGLEQSRNIIYIGATPHQSILPAVKWAYTDLGKRFFLVGSDYVFPRVAHALIQDQLADLGGEVVGEAYLPLGSEDVGPILDQIQRARPQVILNAINGDSNLAFFRALRAAGITPEATPTLSFSLSATELRSLGTEVVRGDYASWNYHMDLPGERNARFVAAFQAKYGPQRLTSDPVECAYVGVHLWARAVARAGNDDPKAAVAALRGMDFEAPEGRVWIDALTQHAWRVSRVLRIESDRKAEVVASSGEPVEPRPFPPTRPRADWEALLEALYRGYGNRWQAPETGAGGPR